MTTRHQLRYVCACGAENPTDLAGWQHIHTTGERWPEQCNTCGQHWDFQLHATPAHRAPALWPSPLHQHLSPAQIATLIDRCRDDGWTEWEIDVRFGRPVEQ